MRKPSSTPWPAGADRLSRLLRGLFLLTLAAALLYYGVTTLRWPMIQDSAVMHYVIFLTRHGLRPYREITDNNMPGAYMLERAAMFFFGGSDLGWRLYDFFLLAVLTGALVVIALPVDWLAGVFAGGLFALLHGTDGLWFAAEREQVMTVLIATACAFLCLAVRRERPVLAACFGLLAGMAVSIKPTLAPFGVLALLLLAVTLRRRGTPYGGYLAWGGGGLLLAGAFSVLFLWHYQAFHAFAFVLRTVTPIYAGLNDAPRRFLVLHFIPLNLLPLLGLATFFWPRVHHWNWERWLLCLAALSGMASYFLQRKGFPYHRYMFLAFALLLVGMEVLPLTKRPFRLWWVGGFALLYATLFVIPRDLHALRLLPGESPMATAMEADLQSLGGSRLQGHVQCFDLILGCLDALYHQQLMENTGFTGDMLLFSARPNAATAYYQGLYQRLQAEHPATLLLVTNEDFGRPNSFNRLASWPAFQANLAEHYTLAITRSFPNEGKRRNEAPGTGEDTLAYRIYLRKGADVSTLAAQTREASHGR